MNPMSDNKSRPEQAFIFVDNDYKYQSESNIISKKRRRSIVKLDNNNDHNKVSQKSKKRSCSKTKQKKYVPGEYIYDTKGQMAEIKYIGQCHKGPGTWYGIEFVDGSLGKHNGTINNKIYFAGTDRRCDMIRADKIRSKASQQNKIIKSFTSPPRTNRIRHHHHKRSNSDILGMQCLSLTNLSDNYSDNYFRKKQKQKHTKKKRKRNISQPPKLKEARSFNAYLDIKDNKRSKHDRNLMLFGSKSREEKVIYNDYKHRQYQKKAKQVKTVKKEKYKGNKYIMAMEQETEKRRHERIGFIKKDKKRVKKQKHERTSSKVQEILKRKELEKEQMLKLNEQHKLKDLERIQAAKEKSKKLRVNRENRIRSNSDHCNNLNVNKPNIIFHSPDINKINRVRNVSTSNMDDFDIDDSPITPECKNINSLKNPTSPIKTSMPLLPSLKTSTTPLADDVDFDADAELNESTPFTPVPSEFPTISNEPQLAEIEQNEIIEIDIDEMDANDTSDDEQSNDSENSSNALMDLSKTVIFRSYSDSELNATENTDQNDHIITTPKRSYKMDAIMPVNSDSTLLLQELLDQPITDLIPSDHELTPKAPSPSPSPSPAALLIPINSINSITPRRIRKRSPPSLVTITSDTSNNALNEDMEEHEMEETPDIVTDDEMKEEEEEKDDNSEQTSFHFPISHGHNRMRSSSCSNMLKRADTVPILHNDDDKGTDYWINEYKKMNKKLNDTQSEIERKMKLIIKEDEVDTVADIADIADMEKPEKMSMSKSVGSELVQNNKNKKEGKQEENDEFYFPMSSGNGLRQRSASLSSLKSTLKRIESAPIITNDDKGTDYWIKQYNKANKKKSKSSKCKTKKSLGSSTPKHSRSPSKKVKKSQKTLSSSKTQKTSTPNMPKIHEKPKQINLPKPSIPITYNNNNNNNALPLFSTFNSYSPPISDDISDIASSVLSNDPSLDSITIGSAISSLLSSPISSAGSTPNTNNDSFSFSNEYNMIKSIEMNKALTTASYQSKYGGYPFQRKREQYINKKFTGIARIGHRYLLRDGRTGVVRYVNATRFAPGTWVGMELDKNEGEHDGIVNGVRYFHCPQKYGTFVKKSQIAQYIARDTTKSLSKEQLRFINYNTSK